MHQTTPLSSTRQRINISTVVSQTWRHRSVRSAHHLEQRFDVCMHRVHRGLRGAKAVPQLVDILLRIRVRVRVRVRVRARVRVRVRGRVGV